MNDGLGVLVAADGQFAPTIRSGGLVGRTPGSPRVDDVDGRRDGQRDGQRDGAGLGVAAPAVGPPGARPEGPADGAGDRPDPLGNLQGQLGREPFTDQGAGIDRGERGRSQLVDVG